MKRAFRHALAAGLVLFAPVALAADPACKAVAAQAETRAAQVIPRLSYRVVGQGRLFFHSAPTLSCRTGTFVVPQDELIGYTELQGWLSVMYTNPRTGQDAEGWVRTERLRVIGTMGPAP